MKHAQRGFANVLILIALALAGLAVAWTWVSLTWSYSKGERAGFVQKLSQKGWGCKTWEGELLLVSMPGQMPEKFFFSVRDDGVAKRINEAVGKRVALTYEQHVGVPTSCFAETDYFVTDVQVLDN